jgi:hypothetical protein
MHDHQPPGCIVVDIQNGGQSESCLEVYANGRIRYHRGNDDLFYGKAPPREEWVEFDDVADRWPDKVAEVHQALRRMGQLRS